MPVYEYKCTTCDERLEVEQSFTDDSLTELEGCDIETSGLHQLKKVFSAVGISFKGEGFYKNDSRGTKSSTVPKADSATSSSSDASSNSETAKPTKKQDAKADTKSKKPSEPSKA